MIETLCDACGMMIPEGDDRIPLENDAAICGNCYDDFCIYYFED